MSERVYERRRTQTRVQRLQSKKKKESKLRLLGVSAAFAVFCAYAGGVSYFNNHFYRNTTINNVDVSYMDAEEAYSKVKNNSLSYNIKICGRDNINDIINAEKTGLKITDKAKAEIQNLKSGQSSFLWILGYLKKSDYKNYNIFAVDEDKFENTYKSLKIVNNKNIIQPKEPYYKYDNNKFKLVSEVKGNVIIDENLKKNIKSGILDGQHTINLVNTDSYKNPTYTKDQKEVIAADDTVNAFKDVKLTYIFDDGNKIVDGSTIENWFSYGTNFNVSIDKKKINAFVDALCNQYGNPEKRRQFKTSKGKTIIVTGGDYGNVIDKEAEVNAIINMLNNKKSEQRMPFYKNKEHITGKNDIGNTYVEVDLTNQHLWFYKDGSLVTEGNVVSGNVSAGHGTPAGVYRLKAKQEDAVLVGDDYRTPVKYWMPFNGGIGIHDANWRSTFGGKIFYTNGSHGCVNSPYALAQVIFENIDVGTPIVCYY